MKAKLLFALLVFTTFCTAQIINFPDPNFKLALLNANYQYSDLAVDSNNSRMTIDTNHDGEIQVSEAVLVYKLNINSVVFGQDINSIEGINYFTNLRQIDIQGKNLGTFSLNGLPNLQYVYFNYCNLTSYSITNCPALQYIQFQWNLFTSLDFTSLPQLLGVGCSNNSLTSLTIAGMPNLRSVDCSYNQLTALNVQGLSNINVIQCDHNMIGSLNANGLSTMQTLTVNNNQLTNLTVQGCSFMQYFNADYNQLSFIDMNQCSGLLTASLANNPLLSGVLIKNGAAESLYLGQTNTVDYICCDDFQEAAIKDSFPNAEVNTFCTFVPGGRYFVVNGKNTLDVDLNGCSATDPVYPNFKVNFTDGSAAQTLIPNTSGVYSIAVGTGNFTLTPVIDDPTYYAVSPTTATVSFPSSATPAIRNFCISPTGVHHDVKIALIPLTTALAGSAATYRIIYKNKGNQIESGSITFTVYAQNAFDYVSSNPAYTSENTVSNQRTFTWNYSNLQQFETRQIDIVLNLNSPSDTPPLHYGYQLHFNAAINCPSDEDLTNNTVNLYQTVVSSYDPNDKACLEGTVITPDMVGKYVHYLIRFENTGTANAQNVVVQDIIDTNKFDITSLRPISGSHDFETRISGTNKVDFVFQNINLPFDDAHNDGYVCFEIKTKPFLFVGSTFSNAASIYFDYNLPIDTNEYITTVQNTILSLPENGFVNNVVYPNPVKDVLHFEAGATVVKAEIYDTSGRILNTYLTEENKIDLHELKAGNYILKLYTEKGVINTKVIKE